MQNEVKIIRALSRAKVFCDADMCDDAVVEIESALALLGEQVDKPIIMAQELQSAFKHVEDIALNEPIRSATVAKRISKERLSKLKKARK